MVLAPMGAELRWLLATKAIRRFERTCVFRDARALFRQAAHQAAPVVLLPPVNEGGGSIAPMIASLRERVPRARVGLICVRRRAAGRYVLAAIRAGAAAVLFEDADCGAALDRLQASAAPPAVDMEAVLGPLDLPPGVLRACLRVAMLRYGRCSASELAASMGLRPTALSRTCRLERAPSPREIIRWARVLSAIALARAERPALPERGIAYRSGFPSTQALRAQLRLCAGLELESAVALADRPLWQLLRERVLVALLRRA